jgi:protein-disulfide isomerase
MRQKRQTVLLSLWIYFPLSIKFRGLTMVFKNLYNVSMANEEPAAVDKIRSMNKTLVVALIIAAFFLGSFANKIATLEKGASPTAAGNAKKEAQANNPTPAAKQPKKVSSADHIRGNKNAKVTLIEYSDFECPFCKNFDTTINDLLKSYGDKVRLVYRHYPLPFHANAQKEAEASECVAQLGGNDAFWKYADAIYQRTTSNGTGFALSALGPLAAEVGVDQQQFQSCLDSGKYEKLVKDSITEGSAAGVQGTPSTFIIDSKGNSELMVGAQPIDSFKTAIDKVLAAK